MVKGTIFKLTNKNSNKIYIGYTTCDLNQYLKRLQKPSTNTVHEIIDDGNFESEILEQRDFETVKEINQITGNYQKQYSDNLVNKRKVGRTPAEYQRDYYRDKVKPNRDDGNYRQLNRYRENKEVLLRDAALKNVLRYNRRPTATTMAKHNITEQEVHQLLLQARTDLKKKNNIIV